MNLATDWPRIGGRLFIDWCLWIFAKREGHSLIIHSQGGGYVLGRTRVCNRSSHMDQEAQEA